MKKQLSALLLIFSLLLSLLPITAAAETTGSQNETAAEETVTTDDETSAEEAIKASNEAAVWSFFHAKGFSDAGIAGIMGNIKQESDFLPNNLENTANSKSGMTDAEFTAAVDDGTITRAEFISSTQFSRYTYRTSSGSVYYTYGYGLAQWTFYSRKADFYDFWKSYGSGSISDLNMQLNFMYTEISASLKSYLTSASDVSDACLRFHNVYEGSNDSASRLQVRINYAQQYYDRFALCSHVWDDGAVTEEPSAEKTGTMTYTCTVCGMTKAETIPQIETGGPGVPTDSADVTVMFTDVTADKWYVPYIQAAIDIGFMSGTGSTTFTPDGSTSRAMFVQILYAMADKPDVTGLTCPFTDVLSGSWYYDAVVWAYNNNVTNGISDTEFGPALNVTREQVALLLYAYMGRPEVSGEPEGFEDTASVDSWALNAVLWATKNGIMSGAKAGDLLYLNPLKGATRAETAAMMNGFYQLTHTDEPGEDAPDEGQPADSVPAVQEGRLISAEPVDAAGVVGLYTGTDGSCLIISMYSAPDSAAVGSLELRDKDDNILYSGEIQEYLTNYYGLADADLTLTVYTDNGTVCLDVYADGVHLDYFAMTTVDLSE